MRIAPVSSNSFGTRNALKGVIYISPVKNGKTQEGIIDSALDSLDEVVFSKDDISHIKSMGITPPFESGEEVVDFLEEENIDVQYGKFSDKKVHACLGRSEDGNATVFINSRYKDSKSEPEILATAAAIAHEAGHAKDKDNSNSIQEELDNLSLNVLTHRAFERENPHVFDGCNSYRFTEGVSLYSKLFFDDDTTALKARVADIYGYMKAGDDKHPASPLANEIKQLDIVA
ncbi:MAG: hypothetical protein LUE64_05060 [Candidatus Gastranaerophilales bacterium]|nr:hypothetical protein [Candidatus Gastranaerophilales bacterium]